MLCLFRSAPLVKKDFTNPAQEMGKKAIKKFIATTLGKDKMRAERQVILFYLRYWSIF